MTSKTLKQPDSLPEQNTSRVLMWYQPQSEIVHSDCNVVCGIEGGLILVECPFTVQRVPTKFVPGLIKTLDREYKVNMTEYRNILRFEVKQ